MYEGSEAQDFYHRVDNGIREVHRHPYGKPTLKKGEEVPKVTERETDLVLFFRPFRG